MPTALPASSDFTGAGVTEGDFKAAISALRDFLSGLIGADGAPVTALATLGAPASGYAAKTTTYAVLAADKGKLIDATTGTWTLSLLAAATAGDGFNVSVRNSGTGVITIDPNLTETIDGSTTLAVNAGESVLIYCTGTAWVTIGKSSGVPSGSITGYGGTSAPSGWLLCDGSAISRTTYASLFSAIGTTFGVGDGSSTFNIPDARGRVIVGKDDMGGSAASRITSAGSGITGTTLGATGGAETHTLTEAQMPAHTHTAGNPATQGEGYHLGGGGGTVEPGAVATSSTGGSQAHNNTQPSIVCNYIIKT